MTLTSSSAHLPVILSKDHFFVKDVALMMGEESDFLEGLNINGLKEVIKVLRKTPEIWHLLDFQTHPCGRGGFERQYYRLSAGAHRRVNLNMRRLARNQDDPRDTLAWLIGALRTSARQIGTQALLDMAYWRTTRSTTKPLACWTASPP